MITISIIVPMYQAERYVQECLCSLLHQNLKQYEIICVDDGSVDGTAQIVRKYAEKYSCIRYYYQTNQGVSAARNLGLCKAKGKYVMFVDADDRIKKNSLRYLYGKAERSKADILVFGGQASNFLMTPDWVKEAFFTRNKKYVNCSTYALFHESGARPSVCNKVFKKKLLDGAAFEEKIAVSEDLAFLFEVFPRAISVVFTSRNIYQYRMSNEESAMHVIEADKSFFFENHLRTIEYILKKWESAQILKQEQKNLKKWIIPFLDYVYVTLTEEQRTGFASRLNCIFLKLDMDPESGLLNLAKQKEKEAMSPEKIVKSFAWQIRRYGMTYGLKSIILKIAQFKVK